MLTNTRLLTHVSGQVPLCILLRFIHSSVDQHLNDLLVALFVRPKQRTSAIFATNMHGIGVALNPVDNKEKSSSEVVLDVTLW